MRETATRSWVSEEPDGMKSSQSHLFQNDLYVRGFDVLATESLRRQGFLFSL